MTNELTKWFDAMTTTCLNVNPRLLDGVNVGVAKSELLSSATITIQEGKSSKGGQNKPPQTARPSEPLKAQATTTPRQL